MAEKELLESLVDAEEVIHEIWDAFVEYTGDYIDDDIIKRWEKIEKVIKDHQS